MNVRTALVCLMLSVGCVQSAIAKECPERSYRLIDVADYEDFKKLDCSVIRGGLTLGGSKITNFNALKNITQVLDLLLRPTPSVTDVSGLRNLRRVTRDLTIERSNADALVGLREVGGTIILNGPTNVDALSNVTGAVGGIEIIRNPGLQNIDGFKGITEVGRIYIRETPLTNIDGLINVETVTGPLVIRENDSLLNIDGLAGLRSVQRDLEIWKNESLTNVDGLRNLSELGDKILIVGDQIENLDGLQNITSFGGSIGLNGRNIENLPDNFLSLKQINGGLSLSGLSISNLDVFANVESIQGSLFIALNPRLKDISGLQKLKTLGQRESNGKTMIDFLEGRLEVWRNPELRDCKALGPVLGWPEGYDFVPAEIDIRENYSGPEAECGDVGALLNSADPTVPEIIESGEATPFYEFHFRESAPNADFYKVTGYKASCSPEGIQPQIFGESNVSPISLKELAIDTEYHCYVYPVTDFGAVRRSSSFVKVKETSPSSRKFLDVFGTIQGFLDTTEPATRNHQPASREVATPQGPPSQVQSIPTLPMLALFILSGLLGLFGIRRLASR